MSSIWGDYLKISLFGESHGPAIGLVINGLPAGVEIDEEYINLELARRAPGKSLLTTSRQEKDEFEIISGVFQNHTTGAPLCFLIRNKDKHSQDYEELKDIPRPGHADYTAGVKYFGFNDYRGGGMFSGRLTAPLVLAGAIAKKILSGQGVTIGSHILSIAEVREEAFDSPSLSPDVLLGLNALDFPVLNEEKGILMQKKILEAREEQDSVGGVVETAVLGIKAGLGAPFFDSVESKLAHLLFSIPGVKGVEFGDGFSLSQMKGSQANDSFRWQEGRVVTDTNHCGGIQGGITNGMPITFKTAFKPTPSIGRAQKSVNLATKQEVELKIKGRHDPCIVVRAVPVVEAAAALALLDLLMEKESGSWLV
ncbi:MAG: chorismate synthase [Peptococcaceae bacterium]|nr:chorismate synthase [Peptococcaceae bacterium]